MNFFYDDETSKDKNIQEICKNSYLIIGGDLRNYELAKLLAKEKNIVYTYGLEEIVNGKTIDFECNNLEEILENTNIIIMPIPFTKDGIILNMPLSSKKIEIANIIDKIKNKIIFAGNISELALKDLEKNNKVIDLMKKEEFAILNALPTAEAIIKIILNNKNEILSNSRCLILGYGRIGKILAQKMNALSVDITCVTNDNIENSWGIVNGFKVIKFKEIEKNSSLLKNYDIIVNTIPKIILTKELEQIRKDALIIDVASKPFGIDRQIVKNQNLNFIEALGLPGKHFSFTVAKNIKDMIYNILQE